MTARHLPEGLGDTQELPLVRRTPGRGGYRGLDAHLCLSDDGEDEPEPGVSPVPVEHDSWLYSHESAIWCLLVMLLVACTFAAATLWVLDVEYGGDWDAMACAPLHPEQIVATPTREEMPRD